MGLLVKELSVSIGITQILDCVDLAIARGQVCALIGPNGAGKTTCVNAITGYVKPTRGSLAVDGVDATGGNAPRKARMGIARTFQHPQLFGTLTPREHVRACRPRTQVSGLARELANQLVEMVPDVIGSELDIMGARLVELARALCMNPAVLLLDEPVAGLDSRERQTILGLVREISNLNIAVLVIEHDMEFVRKIADRVSVLDAGRIVASDEPQALFEDESVVAAYIGQMDERS